MKKITGLLILFLAMTGFIYWIGQFVEFYEYEKQVGFQGEAKRNKYLAAEYFLKAMGQDTALIDLNQIESGTLKPGDKLLITDNRVSMGIDQSRSLLEWVNSGGELIVTSHASLDDNDNLRDYLLQPFGISNHYHYLDENQFDDTPIDVNINTNIEFLLVTMKIYYSLNISGNDSSNILWQLKSEEGTHAVAIKYGQGVLIVLSDMSVFQNSDIDRYDNAAFLWGLINYNNSTGQAYYSISESRLTLLSWIIRFAPEVVLSLLILMAVFLWKEIPRFGPVIRPETPDRRSFVEHIRATGHYYHKLKDFKYLLQSSQLYLLQAMKRKYPAISLEDKEVIIDSLQAKQLDKDKLKQSLLKQDVKSEEDYMNLIKTIETIRNDL